MALERPIGDLPNRDGSPAQERSAVSGGNGGILNPSDVYIVDGGILSPLSQYDILAIRELQRREAQIEQDVPAHEEGLTSSVGALWPPERASFDRVKGIYTPGIVRTQSQMQEILEEIASATSMLRRNEITRVSLRAVVDKDYLLDAKRKNPQIADLIEAQFSLDETQSIFEGTSLVYFGVNHRSRQPLEMERFIENIESAFQYDPLPPPVVLERAISQGYALPILSGELTEKTIDQLSSLYERFGWTRDEVIEILTKPTNIIAVASKDGEIVSAGIAEMAAIPIGNDTLRIVEITEAATREDHSRKGLYTAVSTTLLLELAERSLRKEVLNGEVDVVYGECNGNAPGVLKTARIQGRRFAFEDGPDGVLFQHVPIAGMPKITRYNDLFPAYIPRRELYRRYTNVRQ